METRDVGDSVSLAVLRFPKIPRETHVASLQLLYPIHALEHYGGQCLWVDPRRISPQVQGGFHLHRARF